ncbi:MAG TPA: hypothetical protein VHO70_07115 [Chitinispirillaceae bacterium]|nr:hypothetical protein [Chitinispirillaceae bacterium]
MQQMLTEKLKQRKKVVLLNSRQPQGVSGSCKWVKKTIEAVTWAKDQGYVLITSVGAKTWEISLFSAIEQSVPVIILLPVASQSSFESLRSYYCTQFRIDPAKAVFVSVEDSGTEADQQKNRDLAAVKMADLIVPVSIRKKGSLQKIVSAIEPSSCCMDFRTPYQSKNCILKLSYTDMKLHDEIKADWLSDYLFHWTRTSWKPWPDELITDYYRGIVHSVDYPRTALKTLEHILESQVIFGSDRHMPGKQRCVSFTGETPERFLPLMRWRSRYREMSFEPYGVGIRKGAALQRNVKKVLYTEWTAGISEKDRWCVQSSGKKGNWLPENEYRCKGDFSLAGIDRNDIMIICPTAADTSKLSSTFGIRTVPMFQ